MPISIRLPQDIEQRLNALAERTGRSRTYYIREAIEAQIADLEDIYLAEVALEDLRAGRDRVWSLDEVEKDFVER